MSLDADSSLDQPDVSADDLLALTPAAAIGQLTRFWHVFEATLIPRLASRPGTWAIGPSFTGSALFCGADADPIAAGLLLDLKTHKEASLARTDLFQVITYALLDFDDEHQIDTVGIFSARHAYLADWPLDGLLGELAGHPVSLQATRDEFRQLLLTHQNPELAAVASDSARWRAGR